MAIETKVVFREAGFKEILFSDGVRGLVEENAGAICDRANQANRRGGEGFATNVVKGGYGGGRWIGFVKTTDTKSMIAEAEDKALTGAIL